MAITVIHNPRCTKSRQALAYLEHKGIEHDVRLYLKEGLTEEELKDILSKLDIKPFDLLRKTEAVYKTEFKGKDLHDADWIRAMVANPKLIERPIVIKGNKAVVARPTEAIDSLL